MANDVRETLVEMQANVEKNPGRYRTMMSAPKLANVPKHLLRSDLQRRLPKSTRFRDLTGQKLARATVIGLAGFIDDQAAWLGRCKCGKLFVARSAALLHADAGCGCTRRSRGGDSYSAEYQAWRWIWKHYPSAVSQRWKQYDQFLADVGRKPKKGFSLQRLDHKRPYGPGNAEWHSPAEANRHNLNKLISHGGKTLSITGWAKVIGITPQAMQQRIARCKQRKMDIRAAIKTPPGESMQR